MKHKTLLVVTALMLVGSMLLSACFNPQADSYGVWYNPFSWGNSPLQTNIENGCKLGAVSTTVGNSTYPCSGSAAPSDGSSDGSGSSASPSDGSPAAAPVSSAAKIFASTDGGSTWVDVTKDLGNRYTTTCGYVLFPDKEPGQYSPAEIKKIESTWIDFKIEVGDTFPMVFAGGVQIHGVEYAQTNSGVAFYLGQHDRTIRIRNGELALYTSLDTMHTDISDRMQPEIKKGNKDIKAPLAFHAVSPEVAGYFDASLLSARKVLTIDVSSLP